MTRERTPSLSVSEKYVFVILVTWSFKWCSYVIWVLHVVSIKPHQISSAPGFWLVFSQRAPLHVLCCREVTRRTAPCSPASAESLMRHVSLPANKDYTVNGRWLLTGFLVQEGKHFFSSPVSWWNVTFDLHRDSPEFGSVLALSLPLASPPASSPKAISYHTQGVICKDVIV